MSDLLRGDVDVLRGQVADLEREVADLREIVNQLQGDLRGASEWAAERRARDAAIAQAYADAASL